MYDEPFLLVPGTRYWVLNPFFCVCLSTMNENVACWMFLFFFRVNPSVEVWFMYKQVCFFVWSHRAYDCLAQLDFFYWRSLSSLELCGGDDARLAQAGWFESYWMSELHIHNDVEADCAGLKIRRMIDLERDGPVKWYNHDAGMV